MSSQLKNKVFFWIIFIILFIQAQREAFASHAQSADITYQCLGGNQYQITLSFYRDCAGVAAPATATINISSASCAQNINLTLNQISGTGNEITPVCSQMVTQCSGGTIPGIQKYVYRGIILLPFQCSDWVFSFSLCCRNASIGTIVNPSSENIYVEAHLNNLDFPCNSSPAFSGDPIPFIYVGQPYCINNGSLDTDGDSLFYSLITPKTSVSTTVNYIAPYSASQPLASSPVVTFNHLTGDMCMTPTQLQVTVFAVLVEEWRSGVLAGSIMRDVQLHTTTGTNNNPYVNGINNTGQYTLKACVGTPINFNIYTFDIDTNQNVSISWNNGISNGTFTTSAGTRPIATFSWTPTNIDVSTIPHCFTITVRDNCCPFNGIQTYSFCITVTGIIFNTISTAANCNLPNGSAIIQELEGTQPFTYQWLPYGGNNSVATNLQAGTYTVNVNASDGCTASKIVTVPSGTTAATISFNSTNVSCYGGNNGTVTTLVTGGQQPYTYQWSNGATSSYVNSLMAGTYSLTITTADGCISNAAVYITQPLNSLGYNTSQTNLSCYGLNNGSASISPYGGIAPYTYIWNTIPLQTSSAINNLGSGNHSVIITDSIGCSITASIFITTPDPLVANAMIVNNITCNGLADGKAIVGASGGTGMYNYEWSTMPLQATQVATGLSPGIYMATVTDSNNCMASSTITITEPPPLSVSAAGSSLTCNGSANGQATAFSSGGTGNHIYQWFPTGGTNSVILGLNAGTYSVTVTDANGCTADANVSITQPAPLIVNATGNNTICAGQNTVISALASGGNGNYTYNWNGLGTGANQTVSPATSTNYSITATDGAGCLSNIANVFINVLSLTTANLTVNSPVAICLGESTTINSIVTGNTGPVTINWNNGLGSGNGPFTVSPETSTTYVVIVTNTCNDSISTAVPVTVNPLPFINISPQYVTGCDSAIVNFTDSSANQGSQFLWDFGDNTSSTQPNPHHSYNISGTYNVNAFVTSSFGCTTMATTTATVIVNPGTKAQFTAEAMDGTTAVPAYRFINTSVNSASCLWSFGDGSTSTEINPVHEYKNKGTYKVKLITTTNEGCTDAIGDIVEIKPEFTFYIPTAFTPDGDGNNDYFIPKGQEISSFSMLIFDRWGKLIFQTDDFSEGWNGSINNGSETAAMDIYVYKIELRDFKQRYHSYMGHLTLTNNRR